MIRFVLIFLFAAAVFGVTLLALNQQPAGAKTPAGSPNAARPGASNPAADCSTCPMPSN